MGNLPSGTVTFLFTDIEGSTKLAQSLIDGWETLRARHHKILKTAIEINNGYVFQIVGDEFCASFHTAGEAVRAAAKAQIDLYNEDWGEAPVKIRIGINTGTAQASIDTDHSGGYKGYTAMARVQRIMSAGHGGQVLISQTTEELVRDELPDNVTLRDLGKRRFKDLNRSERVHQLVIANLPADFPPLKTLDTYQHNLPVQLTSFIGRENELVNIAQTIKEHRLVTLTGVGGTGKTRLALQVAANLLDEYTDGVWFVEFASVTNPDLIAQTVISSLKLHEPPGRSSIETVTDFLRSRNALLLLDNCEHLIQECAEFSDLLLQKCTKLKILTTSREPLGILGELILSVSSLSTPGSAADPIPLEEIERFEAVELFVDRACTIHPGFELTSVNAPYVVQICTRLDGIPLALELAAARVRGMGVDQIASRLDHRFRLLTGGSRTVMQRQQTLGATVDWSYNLLTDAEKQLFQMLAVFIGPFNLEAVEKVCRIEDVDVLEISDLLQRLVEKSLVITEEPFGETYYRLLETIRQYGREKLLASGEAEVMANRHAGYFMKLAERGNIELCGPDQIIWLDRLILVHDNLRTALAWVIESKDTQVALQFACNLNWFWLRHGSFKEGQKWYERAIALPDAKGYKELYAQAYSNLIWLSYLQAKNEAVKMAEEALSLVRSQPNKHIMAEALLSFGLMLVNQEGQVDRGLVYMEEARNICQEIHDDWHLARAHMLLGIAHIKRKEYKTARALLDESFNIYKKLGDIGFQGIVKYNIGKLEIEEKNMQEGAKAYRESLKILREVKGNLYIAGNIFDLAGIESRTGNHARAVRLYLASRRIFEDLGVLWSEDDAEVKKALEIARAEISKPEFQSAVEAGQQMRLEEAIEYALEETNE